MANLDFSTNPEYKLSPSERGRMGGLKTMERHGREFYSGLGKTYGSIGGRPRLESLEEIRNRIAQENKEREAKAGHHSNQLTLLRNKKNGRLSVISG